MSTAIYAMALAWRQSSFNSLNQQALAMFSADQRFSRHDSGHAVSSMNERQLRDIGAIRDRADEADPLPIPAWRVEL